MKRLIIGSIVASLFVPFVTFASRINQPGKLSCEPYLFTASVNQVVMVHVEGRNIPANQVDRFTWMANTGTPTTGVGLTFSTQFSTVGLQPIFMFRDKELAGVCAVEVQ